MFQWLNKTVYAHRRARAARRRAGRRRADAVAIARVLSAHQKDPSIQKIQMHTEEHVPEINTRQKGSGNKHASEMFRK
jgi:CRISPR/Cas system Type II protein with McrA/HNH and RuvC-like nuclease domain